MERFEVCIRFDGGLAAEGALDGSDHERATIASRRLLALHASCYLNGRVPASAVSEAAGYQVRHTGSKQACHIDVWEVYVFETALAAATTLGGVYSSEVKAVLNACATFLADSIRSAIGTGSSHLPEFRPIVPVLTLRDGNRAPSIDIESEHVAQRKRLRGLTSRVLAEVARPVGRSAETLTVSIQGAQVAVVDAHAKRSLLATQELEDQIGVAVRLIQKRSADGPEHITPGHS